MQTQMRISLTLLLFVFTTKASCGQKLGFSMTNGILQHQEKLISSAVYQGYQFGILVDYEKSLNTNRSLLVTGNLRAAISSWNQFNNELFQLDGGLQLAYLKQMNTYWQVGPTLKARYQKNLYSLDYGHPFWFTQYSVGVFNKFLYPINKKNKMAASFSLPILGLLGSTPDEPLYNLKKEYSRAYYHNDLKLASLSNFRALDVQLSWNHELSNRKLIKAGYNFNSFRFQNNKLLKNLTHSFLLGIQFNVSNEK